MLNQNVMIRLSCDTVSFARRMASCFMLCKYTNELLSIVECKNMYSIHIYLSPPPIVLNHPTLVLFCSVDWTHTKYPYQGWS